MSDPCPVIRARRIARAWIPLPPGGPSRHRLRPLPDENGPKCVAFRKPRLLRSSGARLRSVGQHETVLNDLPRLRMPAVVVGGGAGSCRSATPTPPCVVGRAPGVAGADWVMRSLGRLLRRILNMNFVEG